MRPATYLGRRTLQDAMYFAAGSLQGVLQGVMIIHMLCAAAPAAHHPTRQDGETFRRTVAGKTTAINLSGKPLPYTQKYVASRRFTKCRRPPCRFYRTGLDLTHRRTQTVLVLRSQWYCAGHSIGPDLVLTRWHCYCDGTAWVHGVQPQCYCTGAVAVVVLCCLAAPPKAHRKDKMKAGAFSQTPGRPDIKGGIPRRHVGL